MFRIFLVLFMSLSFISMPQVWLPRVIAGDSIVDAKRDSGISQASKLSAVRLLFKSRVNRGDRPNRLLARRVLGDADLIQLVADHADWMQAQGLGVAVIQEDGEPDGPVFQWFKWILENQEQIIAFVKLLIELFGGIAEIEMQQLSPDIVIVTFRCERADVQLLCQM